MNAQLDGQNIAHVWHVDQITFVGQKWQFVMPSYYIPKAIVPTWSTPVVGYYTSEPVHVLNPTIAYSKLEHNQLLNQLEQIHNLEQRPSHWPNFQPHVELVEAVIALVIQ